MNIAIWIIQGILSFVFIMAGFMKVSAPQVVLKEKVGPWVEDFSSRKIKTIGVLEIFGAIGLILPMLLNIMPVLTIIAAAGLALTMLFAARVHARRKERKEAMLNLLFLLLALLVITGRIFLLPAK